MQLERLGIKPDLKGLYAILGLLILAAVAVNFIMGVNFFGISNLLNIARGFSILGIASIGQTIVIISGGLDLSVGAVISTANVCAATWMAGNDLYFLPVSLLILLLASLVGLFNGLLVTKRNVPPFIATLGTAIVVNGIRMIWTEGLPRGRIPPMLVEMGVGTTFGVPNMFYIFLLVAILAAVTLGRSTYGRKLYATGTNPKVAALSGIRTERIIILAYVASAVTAALVGILLGGYTGMSDQLIGEGYILDTIAASVLGGAAIGGGLGGVQGTIIGVIIMLIVTNLSLLAHFPIQSQMLIKGVLIIGALWLNSRKRSSE